MTKGKGPSQDVYFDLLQGFRFDTMKNKLFTEKKKKKLLEIPY